MTYNDRDEIMNDSDKTIENMQKLISVSDMKHLSIDELIDAYKNGYRIEETADIPTIADIPTAATADVPINKMETRLEALGTCPQAPKAVGQTVTLSAVTTGGTAPYGVWFYKGGTPLNPSGIADVAEGAAVTFVYTIATGDGGPQTFRVAIVDSCPTGTMSATDSCIVTVACNQPTTRLTVT